MKKSIGKMVVCGLMAAMVMTGCSQKAAKDSAPSTSAAESSAAGESSKEAAPTEVSESMEESAEQLVTKDLTDMDKGKITLGNYKGIEVTKEPVEVSDDEVNAKILSVREGKATKEATNDPVQNGDLVNIDFAGTKDGVAFDGGTAKNQDLVIGSNSYIPGFETGLIGAKKGQEVTLNLTFPANYGKKELAGQAVVFKVTVNNVQKQTVPELNDAFVQGVSDSKTVAEYKAKTRQEILDKKEADAQAKVENDILKAVIDNSQIEPAQEAIDAYYNNYMASYSKQASMYGLDLKTFASAAFHMDENTFQNYVKTLSKSAVEQRLVFESIAKAEGITITDDDRVKLAKDMGYESKDAMIKAVGTYAVDDYLLSTKSMKFLKDQAVIK